MDLEDSLTINKTLKEVFAYMDDIDKEYERQPYLRSWQQPPRPN